jgi:hypothetical protein
LFFVLCVCEDSDYCENFPNSIRFESLCNLIICRKHDFLQKKKTAKVN